MSRLFQLLTFLIRALNYSNTNQAFRNSPCPVQKIYNMAVSFRTAIFFRRALYNLCYASD